MIEFIILAFFPIVLIPITNSFYNVSLNSRDNAKKFFLLFCGVFIFLSLALRSRYVGMDSDGYYYVWQCLKNISFDSFEKYAQDSDMEKGFLFFVWSLSKVFGNPQYLFVITGAVYAFSVCRFIYLNSHDVSLSIVMYITIGLYEFMFQCMRQAIAMCFCLFAVEFCKNRKFLSFLLLVLLAMCFHQTAIVFLPVYFLYGITLNTSTSLLSIIIGSGVLAISNPIAAIANDWFNREYQGIVQTGGYIAVAIYILIIILVILFRRQIKIDSSFSFFYFIMFIGLVIYVMRYTGVRIAERISYYYMFGQLILLPNSVQFLDTKSRTILKCLISILCIALFAYRLSGGDLIPYEFFWE